MHEFIVHTPLFDVLCNYIYICPVFSLLNVLEARVFNESMILHSLFLKK